MTTIDATTSPARMTLALVLPRSSGAVEHPPPVLPVPPGGPLNGFTPEEPLLLPLPPLLLPPEDDPDPPLLLLSHGAHGAHVGALIDCVT